MRAAYRELARRYHPDARGGQTVPEMAEINEAWRVLSDPGRRAVYDASLRPATPNARTGFATVDPEERYPVPAHAFDRRDGRGFPWGWMAFLMVLATIFVFTAGALADDPVAPPTDGLLRPGECVRIEINLDASEVPCSEPHDGVVDQFVPIDTACPIDTRSHRDRQGMGKVCMIPTPSGT